MSVSEKLNINAEEFRGQVVLVTGAANGIGFAISQAFADRGASVILTDASEVVTSAAAELGTRHAGHRLDVTNEQAIDVLIPRLGKIDVLINNAGIGPLAPAEQFSTADWNRTISVNLTGAFLMARAVAKGMLNAGYGRIVNLASQASIIGIEGHVAYCSSKAGLVGMTKCMALEWAPRGVTVNAISPTVIETELGLSGWAGEKGVRARAAIPTRRFGKPWEVAAAACFLAGAGAAMINGENLVVDGGYTVA